MQSRSGISTVLAVSALFLSGFVVTRAQDQQLAVEHPDCSYFSPQRERFIPEGTIPTGRGHRLSAATGQVAALLAPIPGGHRRNPDLVREHFNADSIDSYIFADFEKHNITPASKTTDWEFIRRATLDLTGRIPTADRVLAFVNDPSSGKRSALVGRAAREARVDRQVDHVFRRPVSEHRFEAEYLLAAFPAGPQRPVSMDPRFARLRTSRTIAWPPS